MDAKSLGPVIRKWRIEAGFSQQELGQRAGLQKRAVGAIERGERAPERWELVKLGQALERDPTDLLTRWYQNELQELRKMLDVAELRPGERSSAASPGSASKVDQVIDQIAALAKELYRESKDDFRKTFLGWLAQSDLSRTLPPSSPASHPRTRVSRKRRPAKA